MEHQDTWQKSAEAEMHSRRETNSPNSIEKGKAKVQAKVQDKGKKRPPETCLCCGEDGHRKADCKFKHVSRALCGNVGPLWAVCRNTNTHGIQHNEEEPNPDVTVEEVCCMAVQDAVSDGHCDCTKELETSQDSRNTIMNIETVLDLDPSRWTRRSRRMNRIQLSDGEEKEAFVQIALTDHRLARRNLDDVAMDQSVTQSKTALEGSEHVACQVKIQKKVTTTCLFVTGADAHVMQKYVWEQWGEPTLQTTSATLKGANGQDL